MSSEEIIYPWYKDEAYIAALIIAPFAAMAEGSKNKAIRIFGLMLTVLTLPWSIAISLILGVLIMALAIAVSVCTLFFLLWKEV